MNDATHAAVAADWGGGVSPFGATWQKTMMWIFIITDALLFSGLLCGYGFLRMSGQSTWPATHDVFSIPFIALMTFILITSSMWMGTAVTAVAAGRREEDPEQPDPDHRRRPLLPRAARPTSGAI